MATKLVGPIQFQGKLGTIVGRATRKGNISVGMAPTKYTNPNTPKQVAARTRFLAVTSFTNAVTQRAFAGLARYAQSGKMSIRNAAFKVNMEAQKGNWQTPVIEGSAHLAVMNPNYLKFSRGIYDTAATWVDPDENPGKVKVSFNLSDDVRAEIVDGSKCIHRVIVYIRDIDTFLYAQAQPTATGSIDIEINIPNDYLGLKAYVYAYTQYWGDDTDVNYEILSAISAAGAWLTENSKTQFTKTLFLGSENLN